MVKITAKRRAKAATVHSGGKAKYPVDSKTTARSALKLINNAKPKLSTGQREQVIEEAHKYLPGAKAPARSGKKNA